MTDQLPPEQPRPETQQSRPAPEKPQQTPIGAQEGIMTGVAQEAIKSEQPDEGLRKLAGETETPNLEQQIRTFDKQLRAHYRGKWGDDAPQDAQERQQILDKEFADYSAMTGFPMEDKRRLEKIKSDFDRADMQILGREAYANYVTSHNSESFERDRLAKAERASIGQKVATAPSSSK